MAPDANDTVSIPPASIDVVPSMKPSLSQNDSSSTTSSSSSSNPPPSLSEHLGNHRQYWRDIILGVNDGLVSTFLLVAGVAGGGLSSRDILLTAIAGSVAGSVSMCAGEFIATKSQNDVMKGEIELERQHIREHPQDELQELNELLNVIGIEEQHESLRCHLFEFYQNHPESLLKIMVALEFGVIEEENRSPMMAGIVSFFLFVFGSLPSILPFCITQNPTHGLIAAAVLTVTFLIVVGTVKSWATRSNALIAAAENLVVAGVGGGFSYGVGLLFNHYVH